MRSIALSSSKSATLVRETALILGGSLLIGLVAPLAIRLPFSPVPIAFALQMLILLAALTGSRRGSLMVLAYLIEGLCGMPVFAGGNCGPLYFAGPTGGYLIGYLASAYVAGFLLQNRREMSNSKIFLSLIGADLAAYLFGVAYLGSFIGMEKALLVGFLPFIPGDLLKLALAYRLLRR